MRILINIITFPFSIIFWLVFGLVLVLFRPIQWLAFNLFGYQALKRVVDLMNFFLMKSALLAGVRYVVKGPKATKGDLPLIIVSNHQSMFDIPPMIWFLRTLHPKFIAKEELAKGLPGISYNLRHGGSALINRKNRQTALESIKSMGNYIEKHNRSVVIFPEGTRSDSPTPRRWKSGGLLTLIESAPTAKVLPVTINGSWKILKNKGWPIPFGMTIEIILHEVVSKGAEEGKLFIENVRHTIEGSLKDT